MDFFALETVRITPYRRISHDAHADDFGTTGRKIDAFQNLRSHDRMDLHLSNSSGVRRPGLEMMYSGTASLPMSCKQRGGFDCLQLDRSESELPAHLGDIDLNADGDERRLYRSLASMARGQGFDSAKVQVGHFTDMLLLLGDPREIVL